MLRQHAGYTQAQAEAQVPTDADDGPDGSKDPGDGIDRFRTCCETCQFILCGACRVLSLLVLWICFAIIPWAEWKAKDEQLHMSGRHLESSQVSRMVSHQIFAWNNLGVEDGNHDNVLGRQSYDAFTVFALVPFNFFLWYIWMIYRVLGHNRDVLLVMLLLVSFLDAMARILQSEVGIYGLKQDEPMAFSVGMGFVVMDTGPTALCMRMAWTLFLLRDFLIRMTGLNFYVVFGCILHFFAALFLWGYTNYTHQLYPISFLINYGMFLALIHTYNVLSDQDTVLIEKDAIERNRKTMDDLTRHFYVKMREMYKNDRETRMNATYSQGMEHVPDRMRVRRVNGAGVGFEEHGEDMVLEMETVSGSDEDDHGDHDSGVEIQVDQTANARVINGFTQHDTADDDADGLFGAAGPDDANAALTAEVRAELEELKASRPSRERPSSKRSPARSHKAQEPQPPPEPLSTTPSRATYRPAEEAVQAEQVQTLLSDPYPAAGDP